MRQEERQERETERRGRGRPSKNELLTRQRANSIAGITEPITSKRKRDEEEKIKAEKEFLEKFLKSRKVARSPTREGREEKLETAMEENVGFKEIWQAIKSIRGHKKDRRIKKGNKRF